MAIKAVNFRFDDSEIKDMKKVASVYRMTVTDIVKEAIREYMQKLKKDPFYRLTVSIEEADAEESREILGAIEALSDDDLSIASSRRFTV